MASFIFGLATFALVAALMVLAGLRPARLLARTCWTRAGTGDELAWYLAPVVTLTLWALFLGLGVGLGFPVRLLTPVLWAATVLSAAFGIVALVRYRSSRALMGLSLAAFSTSAILFWAFANGISAYLGGNPNADQWSYISHGQYLWRYSNGVQGGLAPLYQYGAHMVESRYVAPALLGFLSPLGSYGETYSSAGLIQAVAVFAMAGAVLFFGRAVLASPYSAIVYALVVVVGGWTYDVAWFKNFDHLVALAYLPVIAGLFYAGRPGPGLAVAVGAAVAAAFYTYPELSPFVMVAVLFLLGDRLAVDKERRSDWIRFGLSAAGLAALLLVPFAGRFLTFLQTQLYSLSLEMRPGEGNFIGLIKLASAPSVYWGLGPELLLVRGRALLDGVAVVAAGLTLVGAAFVIRDRRPALAGIFAVFVIMALLFIFRDSYSYGAFKMLSSVWWLAAYMVWAGLDGLGRLWGGPAGRTAAMTAGIVLAGLVASVMLTRIYFEPLDKTVTLTRVDRFFLPFTQLRKVEEIVGSDGLLVAVNEKESNMWAAYFLRDTSMMMGAWLGYYSGGHFERSREINPARVRYVLTDRRENLVNQELPGSGLKLIWANNRFRLYRIEEFDQPILLGIRGENQLETDRVSGEKFVWMGGGMDLVFFSAHPVSGRVGVDLAPGPSAGRKPVVEVSGAAKRPRALSVEGPSRRLVETRLDRGLSYLKMGLRSPVPEKLVVEDDGRRLSLKVSRIRTAWFFEPAAVGGGVSGSARGVSGGDHGGSIGFERR